MNLRSRPDIPPQWRTSLHPPQFQAKSQLPTIPVIPDPLSSLSSPPQSPPLAFSFHKFVGKGPARTHPRLPPSRELQGIEDEEYAPKPYNPYNLPPASVIAVEVGSQSQSNNSLARTSPREDLQNPVIPEDDDSDVVESREMTISTFFSPDLDARLPKTPDSDDNMGRRGRPVVQKRIASRGGGAIRSIPRTTRVSPMTTPTKSRFSKDTRDSQETSFACAGAKAVTNNSKRRNLASLLGIKTKSANKNAPKAGPVSDEMMDLDVNHGLDNLQKFGTPIWGNAVSDVGSWDEHFFAAGGGREDRGSGEGDNNGQWTDYLQTVGDMMAVSSMDFTTPRAAPLPPNPSLPTIPTVPSLSHLDDATQNTSVVTSTPRTKERAKKSAKRTGRILSTGFPSPMEIHAAPTTTFGLGLEGIEMELAMAMDTDFLDTENRRGVDPLDDDGDVTMDQLTDVTPTMTTTRTTITNRKTRDKSQVMDSQRQQQPTPTESIVYLPPTALSLKTPFGPARPHYPTTSNDNLLGPTTSAKPFSHNKQLLLTRTLGARTPLSVSKPPVQKLMGKTMISLPSVSTTVVTPRPTDWNEPPPATPTQQPSPLSPSLTPSPEQTPCPAERPIHDKKTTRPFYVAEKPLPVPNMKGRERAGNAPPVAKGVSVNGKRAGVMDEVQTCSQIDECIAATDRMEEVSAPLSVAVVFVLIPAAIDSALLQLFRLYTLHDYLRVVEGRASGDDGHNRGGS